MSEKDNKKDNKKDSDYITVAKFLSPHGVNGYISLRSFTSPDLNIFSYKNLYDSNGNNVSVEKKGSKKDCFIVSVAGVNDRNKAEKLNGSLIYIKHEDLPDIDSEEEYYHIDLVGLDVICSETNKKVGQIISVNDYGAGDLLEIKFLNGKKELYIFSNENFPKVDIKNNYVIYNFPEIIMVQENKWAGMLKY